LQILAHCQQRVVSSQEIEHILRESAVSSLSEISNILSYLKSAVDGRQTVPFIQAMANSVNEEVDKSEVLSDIQRKKIMFLSEQLLLALVPPKQRRYSPDMLATAMIWKTTSTALYKQLLQVCLLVCNKIVSTNILLNGITVESGNLSYF